MSAFDALLQKCVNIYRTDFEGWKVFENIKCELEQALADDGLILQSSRDLAGINEEDDEIILKEKDEVSQPDCQELNKKTLEKIDLIDTNTLPVQVDKPTDKQALKKGNKTPEEKIVNGFASEHEETPTNVSPLNQDSRPKRGASSKALANINKQCAQKLNQKLRRPGTKHSEVEDVESQRTRSKERRTKMNKNVEDDENKENNVIHLPVKIKQERISENVSNSTVNSTQWEIPNNTLKSEHVDDFSKMPPPAEGKRVQRSTRARSRNVTQDAEFLVPSVPTEQRPKRTRAKKQAADITLQVDSNDVTKTKNEMDIDVSQISITEKTKPRRTRKGKRNTANKTSANEQIEQDLLSPKVGTALEAVEVPINISDKLEPVVNGSPILPTKGVAKNNFRKSHSLEETVSSSKDDNNVSGRAKKRSIDLGSKIQSTSEKRMKMLDQRDTIVLTRRTASLERNVTSVQLQANRLQDKTMILAKETEDSEEIFLSPENNKVVGDEQTTSSSNNKCLNETVVIKKANIARDTVVIEKTNPNIARGTVVLSAKEPNKIMNETVIINNAAEPDVINDSLITDDSSSGAEHTPPKQHQYKVTEKPSSAVKERVQQFEEMSSNLQATTRVTRTKTRAMAKKDNEVESLPTSAGKATSAALSAVTLSKLIHTGSHSKQQHQSSSATKTVRSNIVGPGIKSFLPTSITKPVLTRPPEEAPARRAADRDEALKKKEAMLEAQKEEKKQRRELKMAAAAAAREAAAKERQAAIEAQARDKEKREQQLQAEKLEKLKEMERKRLAAEKRHQEMEERRRADEAARQARLEEEQRLAGEQRKKQLEEAERTRIEALNNEKQIQAARQKYLAKEKERKKLLAMKQRLETDKGFTPMKAAGSGYQMTPVHQADGFEFLNSDDSDDEKPVQRDYPDWTRSKARWHHLGLQVHISSDLLDRLFSVRAHTPDLRAIFPHVDRRVLKRTSSAVWRTPPNKAAETIEEGPED